MAALTVSETGDLLQRAEDALRSVALRLLAVKPWLDKPYTDRPELSPWTNTMGPQAKRAYDLSREIRKQCGLPHASASSRALGYSSLDRSEALRAAVADLNAAGITTGAGFEQLASDILAAEQPA